jgi:transposase
VINRSCCRRTCWEWLPADHVVWFLLETVDALDTSAFHVGRRLGGVGTAGYDPDMLLTLLIYAYCQGVRSSRQIERRCLTDVAFRVVCAQDVPDHATVARFRAEHEDTFAVLFTQVLLVAAEAGLARSPYERERQLEVGVGVGGRAVVKSS